MAATPVGMKRFYAILAGIAVVGLGALGFLMSRPRVASIPANVTIQPSDTAGFRGYMKGSESAPVEITEYADYQCPFCQTFATLQMPTIEERLIRTGRLRWRYRDFPLQQHQFARLAAHSAACADEQGKYWEQHDRIYEGQGEWSAARDAGDHFRDYARADRSGCRGATTSAWQSGKYAGRIQASSRRVRGRASARRRRCWWATDSIRAGSIPTRSGGWWIRWPLPLHEPRGGRGGEARERLSVVQSFEGAAHRQGVGRAGLHRPGGGVRRHRNQSALRHQGVLQRRTIASTPRRRT